DLNDPATTLTLIKLNSVVGIVGTVEPVNGQDHLTKVGVTCALCHSTVDNSWGPGKYDPRFNIDGQNTPLVMPPAYGLHGVKRETYTGDGPVSYWNKYVAVTQMGGQGSFNDGR